MNRFGLPSLGFGLGLRAPHYPVILETLPPVDWFEIISENFMDTGGKPRQTLAQVGLHYPLVMHGVGLSIGSTDPLDMQYLKQLKELAASVNPAWISDHLCWTGIERKNIHDLLPIPYTEAALLHIVERLKRVQDYLGRPILLENPSTYLEFSQSSIPEWEFLARLAEEADCGLLLDINNVYVTCYNHQLDPQTYLQHLPGDRIGQIHLAGHENYDTHIIDTHNRYVADEVWELYRYTLKRFGFINTMIEWDADIPEFSVLLTELTKARSIASEILDETLMMAVTATTTPHFLQTRSQEHRPTGTLSHGKPAADIVQPLLAPLQDAILSGDIRTTTPETWIRAKERFAPALQLEVYVKGYRQRLFDCVSEDYPALRYYLGGKLMDQLLREYVEDTPSTHFNLAHYIRAFPAFVRKAAAGLSSREKDAALAEDIAQVETVMARVFDMPETVALAPVVFATLTPEQLAASILPLRTAAALVECRYALNDYLTAFHKGERPAPPAAAPCYILIFRHEMEVWRMELMREEYLLLGYLQQPLPIGTALERLLADPRNTLDEAMLGVILPQWFNRWVNNGVLAEPQLAVVEVREMELV